MPSGSPWRWVPSLYFAQGLPYVLVVTVSTVLFVRLGLDNAEVAFYTSWLYLPWVVKPFWSPLVEWFGTRRTWTTAAQALVGLLLGLVALGLPTPFGVQIALATLWVAAFASATHDIAADGLYLLALDTRQQAAFIGVRSTFYRIAMVACEGPLVVLAGTLEQRMAPALAWSVTFGCAAAVALALSAWHHRMLPRPVTDRPPEDRRPWRGGYGRVLGAYFVRPGIVGAVAFLLLYRLAEAQLVKMIAPFLLDDRAAGGLGLTTTEVGLVKGTFGVIALLAGGLLGGVALARFGLRRSLWPMAIVLHAPDLVFLALALGQPTSIGVIGAAVVIEQFGYGFGFAAYTMFLLHLSEGPYRTAHYALGTGIMALGMMVPGMIAGALQQSLGYPLFFGFVALCTVPGFVVTAWAWRHLERA